MVTKNSGGCYGVHLGCLNAGCDPNCDACANRLTNAVNYLLHNGASNTHAPRICTWPGAEVAAETHEEKIASILQDDHSVWRGNEFPHE